MTNQQSISTSRRKKVFGLVAVIAAGFALCTAMKALVCGKLGEGCPCQAEDDQAECGCSTSEEK